MLVTILFSLFMTSPAHAQDAEFKAAYERGMSCYNNLACRPTIAKKTQQLLEWAKCWLNPQCAPQIDVAKQAQLQQIKFEFPPNENGTAFYERMMKPERDPAADKKAAPIEESLDQRTTLEVLEYTPPAKKEKDK